MRNYEIMFIVNPNSTEEEIDKINTQLEGVITAGGGRIDKIEKMGKKRLAYEVDRFREGFYMLFAIGANGDIIKECERRLRVIDAVIKYITVRVDDEVRRQGKIRSYRQKRAARRGSGARATSPSQSVEEAMQ